MNATRVRRQRADDVLESAPAGRERLDDVRPVDWRNPVAAQRYDLVVIGAGTAGLAAARAAAAEGAKVALIERHLLGGTCINIGCVPSKALIAASHTYEKARDGAVMGLFCDNVRVDVNKMQDWKAGIVKKLTGGCAACSAATAPSSSTATRASSARTASR